jgi:hypothetical protein
MDTWQEYPEAWAALPLADQLRIIAHDLALGSIPWEALQTAADELESLAPGRTGQSTQRDSDA